MQNFECRPVSILCASYNRQNGQCTACVERHYLQNGECIYPGIWDDNCNRYENAYCARCNQGYYLNNYTCKQVDQFCSNFNYQTFNCDACLYGKYPQGPVCIWTSTFYSWSPLCIFILYPTYTILFTLKHPSPQN